MAARIFFVSLIFTALAGVVSSTAPDLARAQDDGYSFDDYLAEIEESKMDEARCRNDNNDTQPEQRIDACTRLIEDAHVENDLVGTYYVNRAAANTNSAQSCADVRKGIQVIEDSNSSIFGENYLSAARSLEDAVCR